jgi:hypothetical protein
MLVYGMTKEEMRRLVMMKYTEDQGFISGIHPDQMDEWAYSLVDMGYIVHSAHVESTPSCQAFTLTETGHDVAIQAKVHLDAVGWADVEGEPDGQM